MFLKALKRNIQLIHLSYYLELFFVKNDKKISKDLLQKIAVINSYFLNYIDADEFLLTDEAIKYLNEFKIKNNQGK